MSTVTGQGTTFNLPNYPGELINITPGETPLLSLAGGLTPAADMIEKAWLFGWQTEDLRAPEMRARLEGANAPAAQARARAQVRNVCQIFHEAVETSYSKEASSGQITTPSSAPYFTAGGVQEPISEHAHQIALALKTIARDVNYAFWHGKQVIPTDNTTARQTRGLLEAISTNRTVATEVTGLASGASNIISETGTARANGDKIVFKVAPAELRTDTVYFVVNKATDSFKVAATAGGSAITIADGQTGLAYILAATTLTAESLNDLLGNIFNSGGITESDTATLFLSSTQKKKLSVAYKDAYGKTDLYSGSRDVAGRNLKTIETDFGTLNVILDRALPPDALVVVSMEQVSPKFVEIPGRGVLFEEPLAKVGSADRTQIYGEIGLKYGNEMAHGQIRGLAV